VVKSYLTNNCSQTKKIGDSFAKSILKRYPAKRAIIFGLEGDLGGGKTTFLQGFAKGLSIREKILSPTFILMRRLEVKNSRFENFYHLDCYRIENPKDILALGFEEIIANPRNIVAIEWADRIKKIIPRGSVTLKFEFTGKNKRKITVRDGKNGK
jgi:tRNA threonylcarbamoyl adenosine modification protein YjeE